MVASDTKALNALLSQVRECRVCAEHLPLGPRPILRASETARVLIVGQAPGTRVHETGIPWNDPSGDRLRAWLDLDQDTFYDDRRIAIIPMGFCYPGRNRNGGDSPPRPECGPLWHPRLLDQLPNIEITLLAGRYAQKFYLKDRCKKTVTETVRAWRDYGPEFVPTPHPSWRSNGWLKRNPWFDEELVPELRTAVHKLL
ncbi:MAG: uracil-DNA glycosylase family protein [Rhodospirillales bacterium]|nr:uracil-DNA glycosylase family protein [Rhodospirillales bacterium]